MATYYVGSVCRLSVNIQVSSSDTDPTALSLLIEDPSGNTASYTYAAGDVTKTDTGDYYYDLAIDEAGEWQYRWFGTGTAAGAVEGSVYVNAQTVSA